MGKKYRALSLFANVGVAEAYLEETDVSVVVANELEKNRADFYKHLYPDTHMICGDITDGDMFKEIIKQAKKLDVNMIIATPPCQGMSTAGKKEVGDVRNALITYAVAAIKSLSPEYVFLENVPEQLTTKIQYNGCDVLIPEYLQKELGEYHFSKQWFVNAGDYGVPQIRLRAIFLLTKKTRKKVWEIPDPEEELVTMEEAIGHLPSLDPLVYDVPYAEHLQMFPEYERKKELGEGVSKWHTPPKHVLRQVVALSHTPTGKSAFENIDEYKPRKTNGELVRGYKNTYKRQHWDAPAYTITMYNRTIGSQNNVHPGRHIGYGADGTCLYSDARVLTVYEIMLLMSLPADWNIPDWATEAMVRSVVGEGIPPLLMKKIMRNIPDET